MISKFCSRIQKYLIPGIHCCVFLSYCYSMKRSLFILSAIFLFCQLQAQPLNVKAKSFSTPFITLYKSAGNYFKEVKGSPIISTLFTNPDTIGYRLKLLPEGATDWKHISVDIDNLFTVFFKAGEYSQDSAEVARRFNDLIALIKETDPGAVFQEDNSYSDTKIKEVNICPAHTNNCSENDKWRVSLYFHKMLDGGYNVSVNIQSFPE